MELMNKEKDEFEFLKESGYQYHRSKKLNSMSLKNFLETLEKRIVDQACKDDAAKEIELVDRFIALVEEEKDLYLERTLLEIKEHEMTPYEHAQRKK